MRNPIALITIRRNRRARQQGRGRSVWGFVGLGFSGILIAVLAAIILLLGGAASVLTQIYSSYLSQLQTPREIEAAFNTSNGAFFQTTKIYDRTGQHLLYEIIDPRAGDRQWLEINAVPREFIAGTIAIEDKTFYENPGYDLEGIGRAFVSNLQGGPIQGGSTITQQLIKNVVISPNEVATLSYERKVREVLLANEVTTRYSKDQILELYLNTNFYGNLAYGVDAAARVYFDKSATELDLAESALLAAIPQFPALNPLDAPEESKRRQELVLDAMQQQGFLTLEQAELAKSVDVLSRLKPARERFNIVAPHFSFHVLQDLLDQLDPQLVYRGGLRVYTTLDYNLQEQVECVARTHINHLSGGDPNTIVQTETGGVCEAANFLPPLRAADVGVDHNVSNVSVTVYDHNTGQIMAMLGSRDYWDDSIDGSFNVAVDGLRQPGSSFKPFAYITAFSQGYTPATMVLDVRKGFNAGVAEPYVPENYDRRFHGPVSLRQALARSYNVPAVEITNWVGVENVIRTAHQMGIDTLTDDSSQYGLALSLGGGEVTLMDMTMAYGVMSNGGTMVGQPIDPSQARRGFRVLDPIAILRIEDSVGQVLSVCGVTGDQACDFSAPRSQQVLSPQLSYLVTDVLSDNESRIAAFGSPNPLEIGRPAAAKTGTTNNLIDNWTMGYTPQLTVGVWVGNTDSTRMEDISGLTGAGPIWNAVMKYATRDLPPIGWEQPAGLTELQVCYPSGLLPSRECQQYKNDIFVQGTEPTRPDNIWRTYQINRETEKLATIYTAPELIEERTYQVLPDEANDWLIAANIAQPPTEYDTLGPQFDGSQNVVVTYPLPFDYVRGVFDITGVAKGNGFALGKVQFGAGLNPTEWTQIGPDKEEPQEEEGRLETFNTAGFEGLYTIQVLVLREDQLFEQVNVPITIDNTAPTVELVSPVNGYTIKLEDESLVIQPNAADNLALESVNVYVNGGLVETSSVAPFTMRWKLPAIGDYAVYVEAVDAAGNIARSETVSISVTE